MLKAIDNWNTEHPDVQVRLETVAPSEGPAQYTREAQAGGGPGILHSAFVWWHGLVKR